MTLGLSVAVVILIGCAAEATTGAGQGGVPADAPAQDTRSTDAKQQTLAEIVKAAAGPTATADESDRTGAHPTGMGNMPMSPMTGTMPIGAMPMEAMSGTMAMDVMQPGGSEADGASSAPNGSVARACMNLIYELILAEKVPPPPAARIYAYTALALYEASRGVDPKLASLVEQMNGPAMPPPPDPRVYPEAHRDMDWDVAAASAISTVAKGMLTSDASLEALDREMDTVLGDTSRAGVIPALLYGGDVGETILDWAATDGYAASRDRAYAVPQGDGLWVATGDTAPLEPYWGTLRPFVLTNADVCAPPPPPAFSLDGKSVFWRQVQEVYDVAESLTPEQRDIALFWSDGPGLTGTPAGHWISIVGISTEQLGLDLAQTARIYALTSVGMSDAFISSWTEKYRSNVVRPVTVIRQHIDSEWEPLMPTPPFPEHTSGHSASSGAASEILTGLLGYVGFEDTTHETRELAPRSFGSFRQAAEEAAASRLYGGIHYRAAIEEGLSQGRCIGRAVLEIAAQQGESR